MLDTKDALALSNVIQRFNHNVYFFLKRLELLVPSVEILQKICARWTLGRELCDEFVAFLLKRSSLVAQLGLAFNEFQFHVVANQLGA